MRTDKQKCLPHFLLVACLICASAVAQAQDSRTILTNVRIFDGTTNRLIENCNVVVEGELIVDPCARADADLEGSAIVDGKGMTLMPGLIDSHVHFNLSMGGGRPGMEAARWDYMAAMGVAAAQDWLADGFTTARDMGGMHDGLRRVIDAGLIDGPH
mgnify:CR=1 FL=1